MGSQYINLDANESAFFLRQLEYIKSKTYDTKYKDLKATMLIPVSSEAGTSAEEITYRSYTKLGKGKIIASYADDLPRVDIFGKETTSGVRGIGQSYGYSIQEIRRSQMTGASLDQRKANAARRANDEIVNDIAFFGDSEYGLNGMLNFSGIIDYTIPDPGSGTEWINKTPDQIIADMSGIVANMLSLTNGKEIPDTMLLPLDQYEYINNTKMSTNSDKTILTWFLGNNQHIKTIEWLNELKGYGVGGTDRLFIYRKDPDAITLEIPQFFEQFRPQERNLEFVVNTHSRCGGVIVYYPLSLSYGDGI